MKARIHGEPRCCRAEHTSRSGAKVSGDVRWCRAQAQDRRRPLRAEAAACCTPAPAGPPRRPQSGRDGARGAEALHAAVAAGSASAASNSPDGFARSAAPRDGRPRRPRRSRGRCSRSAASPARCGRSGRRRPARAPRACPVHGRVLREPRSAPSRATARVTGGGTVAEHIVDEVLASLGEREGSAAAGDRVLGEVEAEVVGRGVGLLDDADGNGAQVHRCRAARPRRGG